MFLKNKKSNKQQSNKLLENRKCFLCNKDINLKDFRDDTSIHEFIIFGLCQKCQDIIFKNLKENE